MSKIRKWSLLPAIAALAGIVGGCAPEQASDPLDGAWEVIHGVYGLPDTPTELHSVERPIQLKIFNSGHFAYVRHKEDGSFQAASAGSYIVEGDRYTETTKWSYLPESIGTRVTFRWRIEGDLFCMSGPVEVLDADGKKVEGLKQLKEVLRRAGTDETRSMDC